MAFTFSCSDDKDDGGGIGGGDNSSLVGTWVSDDLQSLEMTLFSNGNFEVKFEGSVIDIGTYTTSGNSWTIYSTTEDETGTFSISGNKLTWTK